MKRYFIVAASIALLSIGLLAVAGHPLTTTSVKPAESPAAADKPTPVDAPLIVHEWGTFTSFSGSDGVKLEFRPLLENDLPSFVYNRAGDSVNVFTKQSLTALQRMETPVTYFYTPVERDVSVKVAFPEGLLTEYYPPVRQVLPEPPSFLFSPEIVWPNAQSTAFAESTATEKEAAPVLKDSLFDWGQIHLIPTDSLRAHVADEELARRIGRHVEEALVPPASKHFIHYTAARETDSAIIQVRRQPEGVTGWQMTPNSIDYFEKFLFYRGVGNFDLPLTLTEASQGQFELTNAGTEEVRSLFLVSVEGQSVRFHRYDAVAAGEQMALEQSEESSSIEQLAEAMVTSLVDEGLYEKEARAMVKCWKSSWFGEEGTRLLYMVPMAMTDELLPLEVEPQPDEIVRVLVGRMEIMPASEEQKVLELVQQSAAARASASKEERRAFESPSLEPLLAMGRLAEPALVRTRHIATDGQVQQEASQLIRELQSASK